MPLDTSNMVTNGHLIHQDILQFANLLTGVMTDQPVTIGNTLYATAAFNVTGVSTFNGNVTIASGANLTVNTPGVISGNGSIPPGGNANQVLAKNTSANYNVGWATVNAALTWPLLAPNGLVGAPSYSFSANPATGLFSPNANQIAVAANGVQVALFTSASLIVNQPTSFGGALTFTPDNTLDLGQSAALRPRNVYVGTSVNAPTFYIGDTTRMLTFSTTGGNNQVFLYNSATGDNNYLNVGGMTTLLYFNWNLITGAGPINNAEPSGRIVISGTYGGGTLLSLETAPAGSTAMASKVIVNLNGRFTWASGVYVDGAYNSGGQNYVNISQLTVTPGSFVCGVWQSNGNGTVSGNLTVTNVLTVQGNGSVSTWTIGADASVAGNLYCHTIIVAANQTPIQMYNTSNQARRVMGYWSDNSLYIFSGESTAGIIFYSDYGNGGQMGQWGSTTGLTINGTGNEAHITFANTGYWITTIAGYGDIVTNGNFMAYGGNYWFESSRAVHIWWDGSALQHSHNVSIQGTANLYMNGGALVQPSGYVQAGGTIYVWPSGAYMNSANPALRISMPSGGWISVESQAGGFTSINASAFNVQSTLRTKKDLVYLEPSVALDKVLDPRVQPIMYTYIHNDSRSLGFGAEDMVKVVPEVVSLDDEGDPFMLNYGALVPVLWGAVRELSARLEALETR